jgi:glycosyltransferase involved in cell wall biosynthesis
MTRIIASSKKVIAYVAGASGDWGGASRVLFTNIRLLDRNRFEPLLMLPSEGPIVPVLQGLGVRHVIWGPIREPRGALRYGRDLVEAARFLRRNRVALLHFNNANYWRPAEMLAAKLLRIPVITHYHVVVQDPGPFVRLSSLIAVVSEFAAKNSLPGNVPKAVIHNSVSLERFDHARDVRHEFGLDAGALVVAFIGQIRRIKGIDLFIRMAHRIRGEHVRFLIVGECRDPAKFEGSYSEAQLRAEIASDRRIHYAGYRTDIEHVYRSSDVIVMPSRWGEPFGLINIEAGAARRPMVSTRDGGIPEIIRHGENGFLVEREDVDSLVRYTQRLIDDENERRRMGERARMIVEQRFTAQPVRRLEEVYEALTEKRKIAWRSSAEGTG